MMSDGEFLRTSCGSPNYAAPEVISGRYVCYHVYDQGYYDNHNYFFEEDNYYIIYIVLGTKWFCTLDTALQIQIKMALMLTSTFT